MNYQENNWGNAVLLSFKLISSRFFLFIFIGLSLSIFAPVFAETSSVDVAVEGAAERADVLTSFVGTQRGEMIASYDEQKNQHQILFYMGVTLLLFVFLTAGFGIAMGMLGKEVFVQHMVCAGVTVFLAVAHSIVAVVWFFPF
ncbi:MAG: hypothetical protein OEM38_00730 [Gammaproteobacteria bacterium]|nr:hypothetical protein [Gammaproteobacteria bacterium]